MGIQVRTRTKYPNGQLGGARKPEASYHSRCDTIKVPDSTQRPYT